MTEDVPPTNGQQRTQDWLNHLKADFIKLEKVMPVKSLLPGTDGPKWVENLEREVAATLFPIAKLKQELKLTPKRMGAFIGHECAIAVWMMEALAKNESKFVELDESKLPKQEVTPEKLEKSRGFLKGLLSVWYPALRRFAKRCLCSCVDQPYDEMKEFLLSYSAAFAKKPSGTGAGTIGNSAFEIYIFMLQRWQSIEELKSVSHLHQLLVKTFGTYRAGDLKRVQKICQRIGLSYASPGRPKRPI